MKLLPLFVLLVPLPSPALAQCEGGSFEDPDYVGSFSGFEDGRVSFMNYAWQLRTLAPSGDAWTIVDTFVADGAIPYLSIKHPAGVVRGDLSIAGMPAAGDNVQGQVHIRDASGQVSILSGSDGEWGDAFGERLAQHGDLLVVGATMERGGVYNYGPGKGYVFERGAAGWAEVARLGPRDWGPSILTDYGLAIDTDGTTIVFGSAGDHRDPAAGEFLGKGAVYVYEKGPGGWQEVDKLFASNPAHGAHFGFDVAVLGDLMFVGAPAGRRGLGPGSVYVFQRSAGVWREVQQLAPSQGAEGDRFGWSLDVQPGRVAIGAPETDGEVDFSGALYVFEQDPAGHWSETLRRVGDSEGGFTQNYGDDVLLADNKVFIMSRATNRVHTLSLGLGNLQSYCTSTPNSSGAAAELAASGCDSVFVNELSLEARHLPANAMGLFFYGPRPAQYPLGNGLMCVGAGRRRLGIAHADAAGVLRSTIDFRSPQASRIQPGATWYFQAYFRDDATGAGFDFSDGLAIEIRH